MRHEQSRESLPGEVAGAVEPADAGDLERMNRPRGLRGRWVAVRLVVMLGLLCVAAVLVVEGILVGQIGMFDQERPLIGRVGEVVRGDDASVVAFSFVTREGRDLRASCEVPNRSLEQAFRTPGAPLPAARPGPTMAPGQTLEVLHRRGVLGVYACPREGLALLHAVGARTRRWGYLFGALSLVMLTWLIADLWRYSRVIESGESGESGESARSPDDDLPLRGSVEP